MQYQYSAAYGADDGLVVLLAKLLTNVPSVAFSIAAYVLTALALYAIAKRRGINHPWLSWIPVVNIWILGSISDQYRYVVRGEICSKRKALVALNVITSILSVIVAAMVIIFMVFVLFGAVMDGLGAWVLAMVGREPQIDPQAMLGTLNGAFLRFLLFAVPLAGTGIAVTVLRFMALYDLYTSCDPGNNVLYLVLSILFPVTEPFFLFFSRQKDGGMPPRREEKEPVPPREPWDNDNL